MRWKARITTRHPYNPDIDDLERLRDELSKREDVIEPEIQAAEGAFISSSFELEADDRQRAEERAGGAFANSMDAANIGVPSDAVQGFEDLRRARFQTIDIEPAE